MFQAFIVDDDKFAVEATCKMFPWQELNVTQIEKIYSPNGLAERILTEKPQIVFIDIEMGDVSGLDIMRRCKADNSDALFVIISGHDNFDYAHTAVNLGAIYYLLKPIDFADVENVTAKLKQALVSQTQREIADYLLTKDSFEAFFAKQLSGITSHFIVSVAPKDQMSEICKNLGDALIDSYKIGRKKYLFLIKAEAFTAGRQTALAQYAAASQLVLGVSLPFEKTEQLYDSFCQANLLSYHLFIHSAGALLFWRTDIDTGLLTQLLDETFSAIDTKNLPWLEDMLKHLPDIFIQNRYTMHHVVWFYNTLIGRINMSLNREATFSQMDEEDLQMYFQNLTELCASLLSYIRESIASQNTGHENAHDMWSDILKYIEQNYTQKIRAQDICSTLFISPTTLYNAFKANTQQTFVEYLTCFRLEKAKQLLRLSPKTIPQIAEAVGIKDHYYFNKVFKKYTGLSVINWQKENCERRGALNEAQNEGQNVPSEN